MTQDYLFNQVSVKVRSICDELGYTVRFFRANCSFRVYPRVGCSSRYVSSVLIERISKIEHVNFDCVVLLRNSFGVYFTIDNLKLLL